jgi:hypothetical protein
MDCVCGQFRGWMVKTQALSAFERGMVVGARRSRFVLRTANTPRFFTLNSFSVYHERPTAQRTFQPIWHNCGKHWSRHGPASLWNAFEHLAESHATTNWGCSEGQKEAQLNVRKVFLMFCPLCVHRESHLEHIPELLIDRGFHRYC